MACAEKSSLPSVLAIAEHIIYSFVALALIVPIVMLFVSVAMSMLQVSEIGIFQTVLAILDRVLLVFILVELLYTTRIIRQEHGIITAEPFLLVGLIAVVRRILLVTAQIEEARGTQEFQNLLAELGGYGGPCSRPDERPLLAPPHASFRTGDRKLLSSARPLFWAGAFRNRKWKPF